MFFQGFQFMLRQFFNAIGNDFVGRGERFNCNAAHVVCLILDFIDAFFPCHDIPQDLRVGRD